MKKLIKSSQIERFKSIRQIEYRLHDYPGRVHIPFTRKSDNIIELTDCREETKNDYFQLNVAGKTMDFRLSNQYQNPETYFHPCDKESVIEAMHYYFLDFFGDTVEYLYRDDYKKFVPRLPKLSLCLSFWPDIGTTNITNIEHFLASSPVLKQIDMSLDTPEMFSPESKFYQAESVILTLYINTVPIYLRRFQGRQALLKCNTWDILDLLEFMKRWKSGEGFRKLEYLNIGKIPNDIHRNEFLNALGVQHIDESKTPPTHTLPKLFYDGGGPNTDPIISHSYVVRETDNRVASVSIQYKSFCFGVWDKTEEEFLRMVV
ncbi:hypothetical protein B9Z55_009627 [Caenorhabditis nigoni]|nr:hypothetical protein B9Z55_009627 [Caenorhabditis nigoni]